MSYDCNIVDRVTKEPLTTDVKHEVTGATYIVGGTQELWLNVTYNYSDIFYRVLPNGIPGLDGVGAADSIPVLEKGISQLNNDVNKDYWTASEGNAKRALYGLLALAKLRPDGEWQIT